MRFAINTKIIPNKILDSIEQCKKLPHISSSLSSKLTHVFTLRRIGNWRDITIYRYRFSSRVSNSFILAGHTYRRRRFRVVNAQLASCTIGWCVGGRPRNFEWDSSRLCDITIYIQIVCDRLWVFSYVCMSVRCLDFVCSRSSVCVGFRDVF